VTIQDVIKLIISLAASLAAGGIGVVFTAPAIRTWYVDLNKPFFTPPNWLFGPAWTILYILMGIAAFLIWRIGLSTPGVQIALIAFLIQLILNLLWSIVFFGMHSPSGGVIVIVLLWIAILVTLIKFWGLYQTAGILMIPYLLWVTFAAALNIAIWRLNS